jgi:hypothetical protein
VATVSTSRRSSSVSTAGRIRHHRRSVGMRRQLQGC